MCVAQVLAHLLVPCEDPNSDASIGQALNSLWDALLQLVLNGSAAQQNELTLYAFSNRWLWAFVVAPTQSVLGLKVLLLPPALCLVALAAAIWRRPKHQQQQFVVVTDIHSRRLL